MSIFLNIASFDPIPPITYFLNLISFRKLPASCIVNASLPEKSKVHMIKGGGWRQYWLISEKALSKVDVQEGGPKKDRTLKKPNMENVILIDKSKVEFKENKPSFNFIVDPIEIPKVQVQISRSPSSTYRSGVFASCLIPLLIVVYRYFVEITNTFCSSLIVASHSEQTLLCQETRVRRTTSSV